VKSVTLTAIARIQLDGLLSAQKGTLGELELYSDVREKVRFPVDERRLYVKDLPDGMAIIDTSKLIGISDLTVELENEEHRKLLQLLETWPNFGTADIEWLRPLRAQLKAEPVATLPPAKHTAKPRK
jgi:hypothetical protein